MLRTFGVAEMVEKKVVPLGNGSAVYTPKTWIGKTVLVIREEKPLDVEGEILSALKPFAPDIEGVFLFGSFARKEETADSDIDVLVFSEKPLALGKQGRFDFLVKSKAIFVRELQRDGSLFLHQVLEEARPVFNRFLLEELSSTKLKPDFARFFEGTLFAFARVQQLLDLEKEKNQESALCAAVYSLVLRLKSLFLIRCFAKKHRFSNARFARFLELQGFSGQTVSGFLDVYRCERDGSKPLVHVLAMDVQKLFGAAKNVFLEAEQLVKK